MALADSYFDGDPFSDPWLLRFDVSYENLRAAFAWSMAQGDSEACLRLVGSLGIYWCLGGYFVEGRARLEQSLALPGSERSRARIRTLNNLGLLAAFQGEIERSADLHSTALALARETGEVAEAAVGAFYVGARMLRRGELDAAAGMLAESSRDFGSIGAAYGVAWCEFMSGWVAISRGDRAAGRRCFETAVELGRRIDGDNNLRSHALGAAALLAAEDGETDRAAALAEDALAAARRLGLQVILVMTLTRAAEVGVLLGRTEWATSVLTELLTVLRDTGGQAFLGDALEMAALVQESRGSRGSAARLFGSGDRVRQDGHETPDVRPVRSLVDACRARLMADDRSGDWTSGRGVSSREAAAAALRELTATTFPPADRTPVVGGTAGSVPALLRRTGRQWEIGYGQTRFELPDTKGLAYLARLIAQPEREIHALELMGAPTAADLGDLGPSLDEKAKSAYRRRIHELDEAIEQARGWNDPERAALAEIEREAIVRELAAAVGLGGRNRMTGAPAERARVAVRKSIAAAIDRIAEHSLDLALLLRTTVKTGAYCRYTPDPRLPVEWVH